MSKIYYKTETGVILNEKEYKDMLENEAKALWDDNLHFEQDDHDSFESFLKYYIEQPDSVTYCDKDGNHVNADGDPLDFFDGD